MKEQTQRLDESQTKSEEFLKEWILLYVEQIERVEKFYKEQYEI